MELFRERPPALALPPAALPITTPADAAVLLVDATKGLQEQTHRHLLITALMGVRQVVLAVNKLDLVGRDAAVFARIRDEFAAFAAPLGFHAITPIPLVARERMFWHEVDARVKFPMHCCRRTLSSKTMTHERM
jgi:translation elongation factor EF-Tu-like GTPase